MTSKMLITLLAGLLAAGCGNRNTNTTTQQPVTRDGYHGPMTGPMMRGPQVPATTQTFKSNGQRIYYTATSNSGEPITATGGPHWFQMHGGRCVDCHGPDGQGGYVVPMTNEEAPNITYKALTSGKHEDHPPYTDATIKRAITKGLDPAGNELDYAMPRWSMSDSDLNDLIDYLKTLGG